MSVPSINTGIRYIYDQVNWDNPDLSGVPVEQRGNDLYFGNSTNLEKFGENEKAVTYTLTPAALEIAPLEPGAEVYYSIRWSRMDKE